MSTNFDQKIDLAEWISQAEAARIRKVSRQAISKLIKKGRVRSLNVAGHTLVNRQDVEKFQRQDPGRPKGKGTNDAD